jgi:hypothetical protein
MPACGRQQRSTRIESGYGCAAIRHTGGYAIAMQSISMSNGPCHADTKTKLRAGGSSEK